MFQRTHAHDKHNVFSGLDAVPQNLHTEVQVLILDHNQVIVKLVLITMTEMLLAVTTMEIRMNSNVDEK